MRKGTLQIKQEMLEKETNANHQQSQTGIQLSRK
jgi:hypothetical protein